MAEMVGGRAGIGGSRMMQVGESQFWTFADELVTRHQVMIDRPAGSAHPRFPEIVYPLDYGYLDGTAAADGGGIDVWRGSMAGAGITGAIVTLDLEKRDAEIKLLIGCTPKEAELALATHQGRTQAAVLIDRPPEGD